MDEREYVDRLLKAYCATPGTCGLVHRADRLLAAQLYQRGLPLIAVENALALPAVRRLVRPDGAAPLPTVRSLAYLLPVIDEVLATKVDPRVISFISRDRCTASARNALNHQQSRIAFRVAAARHQFGIHNQPVAVFN